MIVAMGRTQYIYRSKDGWVLSAAGRAHTVYGSQSEAVAQAVEQGKRAKPSQIIVFGNDGRILQQKKFGMLQVPQHPKRGRLDPRKIAMAVGKVTLDRLMAADALSSWE